MADIESCIPLLEEILEGWRAKTGADHDAYRNHLYRMVHFCFALHPCAGDDRDKIVIAACFHDIGIWSDGTLDYLPPSSRRAAEYLERSGRAAWIEEVTLMIDMHHKLRRYDGPHAALVEAFRRADLVDVSLGSIRMGLPRDFVKSVQAAFPDAGFHRRLLELGGAWFLRHPLNPLPFVRL